MGLTVLEIEVGNPAAPKKPTKVEFLIDSGAVYSIVPAPILRKLGIKPNAREEFRLADGSKIVRKKGIAFFKHGKKVGGATSFSAKREIVPTPALLRWKPLAFRWTRCAAN